MFGFHKETRLTTSRLFLRPPRHGDWASWAAARRTSAGFLRPWEPIWSADHLTKGAFRNRVYWSRKAIRMDKAYPFFLIDAQTGKVIGGATLDNVRRGPAQIATLGYWIAHESSRQGLMAEALTEMLSYAFGPLKLGRIEAAALPENSASCALLSKLNFVEEGQAKSYLKINGDWRDHTLFALLKDDRI
ncbi:MAG: GNAT family N-acetyltransferase [Pikeienuella sp.]